MSTTKLTLASTIAAMLALLCAHALGWQHAWWAAMTVWLVIQPNQNLMTGRILARSLGSSIGSIIGAVIILFITPTSLQLLCLGLWLLLSSGLGSIFQQYRNYAFAVAGYTAAIVMMFCFFENNHNVELAYTRILCTFVGVVFCGLLVLPFIPKLNHDHTFIDLKNIQLQIEQLFKNSPNTINSNRIQSFSFELKRIYQYFQFHQVFSKKRGTPETIYSLIQELSLLQCIEQPEERAYLFKKRKEISHYSLSLNQKFKYLFKYFTLNQQAIHILLAITRVIGVYVLTLAVWFVTDWKQAPLMVMTAILFAALFSSNAYAQQALTDVLKGSLLGALFGLIYRLFIVPSQNNTLIFATLFIVLLLGAYLMNRTKTAKLAIDLNMTFLLIAQPLATVSHQTPDILLECLAILSGVVITFIWFRYGVPFVFKAISPQHNCTLKLAYTLENVTLYQEFIYITSLMRADLYAKTLGQNQTAPELKASLVVLNQICITEVENMPPHKFKKSNTQALLETVTQQYQLQHQPTHGE